MSSWDTALAWYRSQIGFREGPNNANPYAAEVRNRVTWDVPGWWANTPYCGIFVMAGHLIGGGTIPGTGVRSEYCPTAVNNWKAKGQWGEYPRVGAWVYFRNSRGVWYHVGVVESFDATHIVTIEANTFADGSSGSGNGVYRKRHRRRDAYVGGYGYPDYSAATPMIYGDIKRRWDALGGKSSILGDVIKPESDGQLPGSRYNAFERGIILWSVATGAHPVYGAILGEFRLVGSESGIGLPLGGEYDFHEGRRQDFQNGSIVWHPDHGAHIVLGEIGARWDVQKHGWPMTSEVTVPVQRFTNGTMVWQDNTVHDLVPRT